MALIVEDGSGKADAEAYVSVADADTLHSAMGATAWAEATTAAREAALRHATRYMDGAYRWKGERGSSTQALGWPRVGVVADGYSIASNVIPVGVKQACADLALRALSSSLFEDIDAQAVESVKVGPIERKLSAPRNSGQRRYASADALLRDLIAGSTYGSIAVLRA